MSLDARAPSDPPAEGSSGLDPAHLSPGEIECLLAFYTDSGIDLFVEALPRDRFAEAATAEHEAAAQRAGPGTEPRSRSAAGASPLREAEARPRATTAPPAAASADGSQPLPTAPAALPAASRMPPRMPAVPGGATVPDEAAFADARALAAGARTLEDLRSALESFTGCNLRNGARSTVFADGNPEAPIMFVGEAPGRDEDIRALPFVGRAGQLLDRMLAAIGLSRETAYITNMIPWRPPGNRTPTPHEIELCRPFAERHIALAAPRLVVFLGNVSHKALTGSTKGILAARGTWKTYRLEPDLGGSGPAFEAPAIATLHPAYLLRNPAQKKLAWADFLEIRARLDTLGIED